MNVRAVFWDFGGVITTSPFESLARYEKMSGLPPDFIRRLNATDPDTNAWAAFERGQLDLGSFAARFEAEAEAAGGRVDARAVVAALQGEIRPAMVEAVRRCQAELTTAVLTNNFLVGDSGSRESDGRERGSTATGLSAREDYRNVMAIFDVVVESSRVGCRKPDPRFYELACELAGVAPTDVVFLDDLGVNLKPARAMGMATIKVDDPDAALAHLESVVGFDLR